MKAGLTIWGVLLTALLLSGCVTTLISPYEDKKDLDKAEQTYIQIGYDQFQRGNMLEAKKALTKALDLNSRSAGAYLGLARVYERELEYDLADDNFRRALRYSDETEHHFQYGVYLYNRGEYKKSYRQFRDVLKDTVYARRAQAFEYQGVVATRLGKTDEAITYYERAIALNAMMSNSYIGLARIHYNRGEFRLGYQRFQGFVELVRAQLSRHNAATLWLGIQLADELGQEDDLSSYELQLRNRFSDSNEFQLYQQWKADKDSA